MTEQEKQEVLEIIEKSKAPKKKLSFSKCVVVFCIALVIVYTGFCLFMQYRTGVQPEPQLTMSFMGFVSVELWSLSKIKRDGK